MNQSIEIDSKKNDPEENLSDRRYLSTEEIFEKAKTDFQKEIEEKKFTEEELRVFIVESVIGVRVNNVDVISIDFEHSEDVHPILSAFIKSSRTRIVVCEYFYPELQRNAINSGLEEMLQEAMDGSGGWIDRLKSSKKIAEICKEAKKNVAVADIANKSSYNISRTLALVVPNLITAVISAKSNLPIFDYIYHVSFIPLLYKTLGMVAKTGIYNKNKISKIEKIIIDMEQARRLFLAKGIQQLTSEYPTTKDEHKSVNMIVDVYPKAHGMRMADILMNPSFLDKAKDIIYRTYGMGLDFSVRTWVWKDSLQRLRDSHYVWGENLESKYREEQIPELSDSLANWRMVSERPITV